MGASCWIEAPIRGRQAGPVRAGMWAHVVVGTYPIQVGQRVRLEIHVDDRPHASIPAYWLENRDPNSLWHVPVPPLPVEARVRYRAILALPNGDEVASPEFDAIVRPNVPDRVLVSELAEPGGGALVGNQRMTLRVDARGSTTEVYYPTVGLHSQVRPAAGELPHSRVNFRAVVGGLAVRDRIDWFCEQQRWDVRQNWRPDANILETHLAWRRASISVTVTDFAVPPDQGPPLSPHIPAPGLAVKRFKFLNRGPEPRRVLFAVLVETEINGGVGETSLLWRDAESLLQATNRGHTNVNRKLARRINLDFAIALDARGATAYEPTAPNAGTLLRWLDLPPGREVAVDLLLAGAHEPWGAGHPTYEQGLLPSLEWFRAADVDAVERAAERQWAGFLQARPALRFGDSRYEAILKRAVLLAALHVDAKHGAVAAGYDRGLNAYCIPRHALAAAAMFQRLGDFDVSRRLFDWFQNVLRRPSSLKFWCGKYTIDGESEWETPAVDHAGWLLRVMESFGRRSGDTSAIRKYRDVIDRSIRVCLGSADHPGVAWLPDLRLVTSVGVADRRYGAYLASNAAVVAGLRSAARLAQWNGDHDRVTELLRRADLVWNTGVLGQPPSAPPNGGDGGEAPDLVDNVDIGLVDPDTGRFLDARRLSPLLHLWVRDPRAAQDRSRTISMHLLAPVVPFDLISPAHPAARRTIDEIRAHNRARDDDPILYRWTYDPGKLHGEHSKPDLAMNPEYEVSPQATLWMARALIRLGWETGDDSRWDEAARHVDAVLDRLCPLGARFNADPRSVSAQSPAHYEQIVLPLFVMICDALLDFVDLDWDANARTARLRPCLPSSWNKAGRSATLPCGSLDYTLHRDPSLGQYRLVVESRLQSPLELDIRILCPRAAALQNWTASPPAAPSVPEPPPVFDSALHQIAWTVTLPPGHQSREWAWIAPPVDSPHHAPASAFAARQTPPRTAHPSPQPRRAAIDNPAPPR